MAIAPTLIIGLGGTGSKIISKVLAEMRETGRSNAERIAFVAFDTDINELAEIRRINPNIKTVQTSTRATVGEYLNINTNARDNWFPVNEMLNRKALTEGAAQVRAISRLAFDTTLKAGNLKPLHDAVDELFRIDKDQEEQALRIIITSSLAGGTGSGLILPVAMYLSKFLRSKYPRAKAITRGFFIQPDVYYSVIPGVEEQSNLQVNAYATVRELDAFLMKGDNTLPSQYSDLVFEIPKLDGDGVEVINAMPYDFCFLFDANNTAGAGLDSFDGYLAHAANCIYTLSLSQMSKKSNSREDNVMRELIKHDGRNRYAGAGASRLFYPWRHVRDYVGFKWADQALSLQWLYFDNEVKKRKEAVAKQRSEGYAAKDVEVGKEFIELIQAGADNKDPFARTIQNQCLQYDEDGLVVIGQRWMEYLTNLKQHVIKTVASGDRSGKRGADSQIASLNDTVDRNDYVAVYNELKRYHDLAERQIDEKAGVLAYTLFRADAASLSKMEPHHLETYLREKVTNDFVHPVSARYFLYQTREALLAEKQRSDIELSNVLKFFETFEKTTFAVAVSEDGTDIAEFSMQKPSLREKIRKKPGSSLQEVISRFGTYVARVDDLRRLKAYTKVLEEALAYVKGLSVAFEDLFTTLDSNLKRLHTDIDIHRTKYDNLKGSTTRYVLASSESLDYIYRGMTYMGSMTNVDPKLSENIYLKVREYHMLTDEKPKKYYQALYDNDILGFFKNQVSEKHQAQIEIDIIEALERECRAAKQDLKEDDARHYVSAEIEKVKHLAAPFIEHPMGEERHPISACAYNQKLVGEFDPKRKTLIDEHLGNFGGQTDPDMSLQEIFFYQAIYGIQASDFSKYAPEHREATDKRPAGAYFAAYQELVSRIKPTMGENRVITPHIDRRWHTIAALPELDDEYQRKRESEVHEAMFLGLIHKVIVWEHAYDNDKTYRYQPAEGLSQDFVVSNGTPCDQFYEVRDALRVDPVAVRHVESTIERRLSLFLEDQLAASFAQGPIASELRKGLSIGQLATVIPGMTGRRVTLFDVSAFFAISVPTEIYSNSLLHDLTSDILLVVQNEAQLIEHKGEALPAITPLLREQFETFRENSKFYLDVKGPQFGRKIQAIMKPFTDLVMDLRLRDLQAEVEAFVNSLREI